jgi:hypothetical protein
MGGDHLMDADEIFDDLKKKQINDGPCAAQIVDCDCDLCLRRDATRIAARHAQMIVVGKLTGTEDK